ncbi:MAG: BtaA family protein [Pseudomonadota bacterium]
MTQTTQDQLGAAVHQNRPMSKDGQLERMFSRLFRGLVYPQIWEDPVVDMAALEIGSQDHVVCLASGGCNMMSYLTAGPASVTAVDLSPAHVALGRLKIAAAQHLSQAEFHRLFADADHPDNPGLIAGLAPHLDTKTRLFWLSPRAPWSPRAQMFRRGFYRHGALGRFIGAAHLISSLTGMDYRPLLQAKTMDEQKAFFDAKISPLFDKRFVRFLARQRASLFGLGIPPAQYDKLAADGGGEVIEVLRERVRKLACDFPISENYFAWQAFNRAYEKGGSVPPYLEADNFETLTAAAPRASITNQSVTDMLAAAQGASKSCYVLLDAQDWMTDAQLNALWDQITRTAMSGARVIFRTGGAPDILPGRVVAETLGRWSYDADASTKGFAADRSAIYGGFHLYRFLG